MQVSVETIKGLERRMDVVIPAEEIEQAIIKRLHEVAKSVKLDGFRVGKIPFNVVKSRFGKTVRFEVVEKLVSSSYADAISQEKLKPAGPPAIEPKEITEGKPLEYRAVFEIFPDVNLKPIDQLTIEKLTAEVSDQDVQELLEKLQKQHVEWNTVERKAKQGDSVKIDFEGKIDAKVFEGGSAQNVAVEIGGKRFIEGFEEGLVGLKTGDEKTLKLNFPQKYPAAELAGKPVEFAVKVLAVSEPKLPEVDDQFAEKLGFKKGGLEGLRVEMRKNMENELKQLLRNKLKEQVMNSLHAANPIEIPTALIDQEIEELKKQTTERYKMQTGRSDTPEFKRDDFENEAKKRVALALLLSHFIKENKIQIDAERVKEKMTEIASAYPNSPEMITALYKSKQHMAQVESLILEEIAIDKMLEQATVKEKIISYKEVIEA